MTESEPTTNDMVNLLRFLGNETEWTYQPNYDESNAIQSFVQAKTSPQRNRATVDTDLFSSPFVSMMEVQRNNIYCVSPSLGEIDEDGVHLKQDIEYREKTKVLIPLDVTELMTSELIDYDKYVNSVPDEPQSTGMDTDRISCGDRMNIQDNDSLSLYGGYSKCTEISEDFGGDRMDAPKMKQARKTIKSSGKNARKTRDSSNAPLRALSAYNFFFRDERDRILNNKDHDWSQEKEDVLLQGHWNRDRSEKRVHCKTHGKLSFTALSKEVSRRWKALPSKHRDFYRRVAQRDWKRYEKEVAESSKD